MNYSKLLQVILDIGEEMLVAGAEVSRVEDSIERMCNAYGCGRVNVFVITSNIQVTMESPDGEIITQIRKVVRSESNFDRLDYLNDLSRYICKNKIELEEIRKRYDDVMNRRYYALPIQITSSMLVAGIFSMFFGGNFSDGFAAALVGLTVFILGKCIKKYDSNQLAVTFVLSFIGGLVSVFTVFLGIGVHTDKIMIGVIMLLIPGIALTNSIRDMLIGDLATGMLRLVNSLLVALAIACGFALALYVTGGGLL